MANTKQASKRARQAEKHRVENKWQVSRMNTYIKQAIMAIEAKDLSLAQTAYKKAASAIDKLVGKGLVHKNKAARHKSRLNKHLLQLANAA